MNRDSESESESGEGDSESGSETENNHYGNDDEPSDNEYANRPPSKRSNTSDNKDLPLFMRLQQDGSDKGDGHGETRHIQRKLRKQKKDKAIAAGKGEKSKKSKNGPAEMPSNKPVRRLRDNVAKTSEKKFRDPRFDELSGRLNIEKFYQNTKFLDEYQEEEIAKLQKKMNKTKSVDTKEVVKEELVRAKQQLTERRRSQKVSDKLRAHKQGELEKVKQGKTPFYLKASAKKELALEARYDELKQSGKLQSFLNKKRKRNSNKDHRKIPMARPED